MSNYRDQQHLEDMKGFVGDIFTLTNGMAVKEFLDNYPLQLAIERLFENIGEAANRLSDEVHEKYPQIPWRKIIGIRNVIAHEYNIIDHDRIFSIIINDLPELKIELDKL